MDMSRSMDGEKTLSNAHYLFWALLNFEENGFLVVQFISLFLKDFKYLQRSY